MPAPEPIDLLVEALDDFGEFGGQGFVQDCGQGGAEGTTVDAAVAQGLALAGFGHPVAVGAWDPFDEAGHAEPSEVICGATGPVVVGLEAEERGSDLPELTVGEAHGKQVEDQQAGEDGVDAEVADAQGGYPALLDSLGLVQLLEGFGAEQGVVAQGLDA